MLLLVPPMPTPVPSGSEAAAQVVGDGLVLKRTFDKEVDGLVVVVLLLVVFDPMMGRVLSPSKKLNCDNDSEDVSVGSEVGLKVALQVGIEAGVGDDEVEVEDVVPDEMTLIG